MSLTMKKIIPLLIVALLTLSCTNYPQDNEANEELSALRTELDSLKL